MFLNDNILYIENLRQLGLILNSEYFQSLWWNSFQGNYMTSSKLFLQNWDSILQIQCPPEMKRKTGDLKMSPKTLISNSSTALRITVIWTEEFWVYLWTHLNIMPLSSTHTVFQLLRVIIWLMEEAQWFKSKCSTGGYSKTENYA